MNQQEVDEIIEGLRIAAELLEDVRRRLDLLEIRGESNHFTRSRIRTGVAIAESKLRSALKPIDPLNGR